MAERRECASESVKSAADKKRATPNSIIPINISTQPATRRHTGDQRNLTHILKKFIVATIENVYQYIYSHMR